MCQYSCNSSGTLHRSSELCWCVHWQCASCNASFGQSSFHRCDSWMDGRWRDPPDNYCQPFSLRTNNHFILLLEWTSSKQDTVCPEVLLTQPIRHNNQSHILWYMLWLPLRWAFSEPAFLRVLLQTWHSTSWSSLCTVRMCRLQVIFFGNERPHKVQQKWSPTTCIWSSTSKSEGIQQNKLLAHPL